MDALEANEIIPDVLEQRFEPKWRLSVKYAGGVDVSAPGSTVAVAKAQAAPATAAAAEGGGGDDESEQQFTLLCCDPDAPSRASHKYRSWLHWLVVNCPRSAAAGGVDFARGAVVSSYMGPAPPRGSGPHRYVFVLFRQTRGALPPAPMDARPSFDAAAFARTHGLVPVAATFFFAENK